MSIDPTSPFIGYAIVLDNMDEGSRERLREDAHAVYGDPWGLALRDFFALIKRDLSHLGLTKETFGSANVRQYVWFKEFLDVEAQVTAILQKLHIPQTDDQKAAAEHCLPVGREESTLIFVRRYFGLHSFSEAEQVTLADFIVARKDHFNDAMYKHTMHHIQLKNMKKK